MDQGLDDECGAIHGDDHRPMWYSGLEVQNQLRVRSHQYPGLALLLLYMITNKKHLDFD